MKFMAPLLLALLTLPACAASGGVSDTSVNAVPSVQRDNPWYKAGQSAIARKTGTQDKQAKNVILFVGDGMGISTVTAARILEGQLKGGNGEENSLSFEHFPYTGLAKTYNADAQTPDSAGTMTALVTGVKTNAGVLSVDENAVRGDCASSAGRSLVSTLELAELAGLSTGIVTTTRITHATPAATYAKSPNRDWEDDSKLPDEAIKNGCKDIATQLIDFEAHLKARFPSATAINGIEVVLGGGRRHFLPSQSTNTTSGPTGSRLDGQDLTAKWQMANPKGRYVIDQKGFEALDPSKTPKVLGLFNLSHMHYEADRHNSPTGEPSLTQMTQKAIDILDNHSKGFFLMVEGGRIDHAHHAGNAYTALTDTIELSNAVAAAVKSVDLSETLIIVTADHSHVFTIAGYPKRGNPILGKVIGIGSDTPSTDTNGLPYTTLGYANGLGYRDLGGETNADATYSKPPDAGRKNVTRVDTEAPGYHQEALIPLHSETHGGEDVAIYAIGPGSHLISGTIEQNVIYHAMEKAMGLSKKAARGLKP